MDSLIPKSNTYGVLSSPMVKANIHPFMSLMSILKTIDPGTPVIAVHDEYSSIKAPRNHDSIHFFEIVHRPGSTTFSKILGYMRTQFEMSSKIFMMSDKVGSWIFYLDNGLLIPMIATKILRKKTLIILGGFQEQEVRMRGGSLGKVAHTLAKLNLSMCGTIVVYTPRLISEWDLEKYRHKILIAHRHFLDFNAFSVTTPLSDRPPLIGYIGRMSEEKGVQNFVAALPLLFGDHHDLHVLFGGDGELKEMIEVDLQKRGFKVHTEFPGWISHADLPSYLNRLRLLVLPSYTEGLPNIMLEAMACGTPVLATPVGGIPDVIVDGETGFLMKNNSPECIAENINRALRSPRLKEVSENGRKCVEEKFTFEHAVNRWRDVLEGG